MTTDVSSGSVRAEYTAVVKQDDAWWIGWIEEVPGVNCQERSCEKLLDSSSQHPRTQGGELLREDGPPLVVVQSAAQQAISRAAPQRNQ